MYRFNLQTVLNHRQYIEDNLTKELADLKQAVHAAQQELKALKGKEMNTATALKQEQVRGLASNQVVAYQVYLQRLATQIVSQQTAVDHAMAREAEKKEELLEAMKKRQILERLKEQGLERYNQEMLKKEMAFIDEMAVNRFVGRRIRNNGEEE